MESQQRKHFIEFKAIKLAGYVAKYNVEINNLVFAPRLFFF